MLCLNCDKLLLLPNPKLACKLCCKNRNNYKLSSMCENCSIKNEKCEICAKLINNLDRNFFSGCKNCD